MLRRRVGHNSEIVSHGSVKSTALPKLRRANADAAAIANLVNFVEQVHDIEPDFDRPFSAERDSPFYSEIQRFVGMILLGVGEAASQSISVERVGGKGPIVPSVGYSARPGETLIVVEKDPVILDEGKFIR